MTAHPTTQPNNDSKRAGFVRALVVCSLYLVGFLFFDVVSMQFQQTKGITAWYPPVGFTYAFLLIFGIRFLPVVALALVCSSTLVYRFPDPLYMHLCWGLLMAVVYSLAAEILRSQIGRDQRLKYARSVAWLVVVAAVTSAGLAVVNVVTLLSRDLFQAEVVNAVAHWWIGEMVGILTLTPFLLLHVMPGLRDYLNGSSFKLTTVRLRPHLNLAFLAELAAFVFVFYLVFGLKHLSDFNPPYLIILPLLWVILRHGSRGGVAAVMLVNFGVVFALWLSDFEMERLSELQLLMVINCIAGLVFGTLVTSRKRAEQELAQLNHSLEERVRQRTAEAEDLYENAPTGYHSLDERGCFLMINQTELDWLGCERAELLGRPVTDFMTPASQIKFAGVFAEFKISGRLEGLEMEFLRKDGSVLPVAVEAMAVYDVQGNFLMSRSAIADITRRKQAEEALRANKELLQGVIDYTPELIYILDTEGRFLLVNHPVEKLFGFQPGQVIGKTRADFLPEEEARRLHQNDLEIIRSRRSMVLEEEDLQPDGMHYYLTTKFPLLDANDQVAAVCGISADITERKQVEVNLRESRDKLSAANAALEQASRLKDEFLASMSHELRTPLTGILGLAESLQMETYGALSPKQMSVLANIEGSGRHLLALINDVLDLSKIGAEKLDMEMTLCPVNDICQASLQMIRGIAHQKSQSVCFSANPVSMAIQADPRRFKQMLVNLLSNAVKFTPEGGSLGLEVEGDAARQQVRLCVWDRGIGIKTEDLGRLFKPFTQLDSSLARQHAGTGLGLSLVAKLAELHSGSVSVESVFGEGSRFTLTLPWQPQAAAPARVEAQAERLGPARPEAARTKGTILLVDDDEVILESMADFLSSQGYQLVLARSGKELVELAPEIRADLILTDIQMPGMDGIQAIRQIRAAPDAYLQQVPIIAVTALAMPGDETMCLSAGANQYVSKPVTLRSLVEMIESLMAVTE